MTHSLKVLTVLLAVVWRHADSIPQGMSSNGDRLVLSHTSSQETRIVPTPDAQPPRLPTSIYFNEAVQANAPFRIQEPPLCHSRDSVRPGYCLDDPEYNSTIIRRFQAILENDPINNIVSDVLNETVITVERPAVRNRISSFVFEQTPCLSRETIIYPKRGQTPNNDWVFILNQGNIQQGVKVEKCLMENSECQFGAGGLPQTACRQKYIYKKLLTMDTAGKSIVSESVYLPSCCVCYVSSDFISSRNALPKCLPAE